jgi:hypothetical protein
VYIVYYTVYVSRFLYQCSNTTLLLKKFKKVREPLSLTFTLTDICNSSSKWREKTTTSPSNKHLGIYRALIIANKLFSDNNADNVNSSCPPVAFRCLQIKIHLMTLAIHHCHTYKRWSVVHNFLQKKHQEYLELTNFELSICTKQTGV